MSEKPDINAIVEALSRDDILALKEAEFAHNARQQDRDGVMDRITYPKALRQLGLAQNWVLLGRDSPGFPGMRGGITQLGLEVAARFTVVKAPA